MLWFVLPDSPLSAKFLSEDEKKGVLLRIRENNTGLENETFKKAQESALIRGNKFQAQLIEMQFVETLLDIKTWLFFFFSLFLNSPNGAFINVSLTTMMSLYRIDSYDQIVSRNHHQVPRVHFATNDVDPASLRSRPICSMCDCQVSLAGIDDCIYL